MMHESPAAASESTPSGPPTETESRLRGEHAESPIVVGTGGPVTDLAKARLLLAAMLDRPEVPKELEVLVWDLIKHPEARRSEEHFVHAVAVYLQQLQAEFPDRPEFEAWANTAVENLTVSAEAARAYRPEGRENPRAVWYPMPEQANNPRSVFEELPWAKRVPLIDRTTKIGSAGSCFASEISYRLQSQGFNYIVREASPSKKNGKNMASANWGILFNTPSLRQLIERSFGLREMPPIVWPADEPGGPRAHALRDPWREEVEYDSIEEYHLSWARHLEASRKVLEEVDVFVMTLGLSEVWEMRTDGTVFSRCPWRVSPSLVRQRVLSVEENLEHLEAMWSAWKRFNPGLRLILTVSPVPLLATFRGDEHHVLSANAISKSTLRIAADRFAAAHEDVHYFPSFETVMYCARERWNHDNRHVSDEAVGKVMQLFDLMYLKDGARSTATGTQASARTRASLLRSGVWRFGGTTSVESARAAASAWRASVGSSVGIGLEISAPEGQDSAWQDLEAIDSLGRIQVLPGDAPQDGTPGAEAFLLASANLPEFAISDPSVPRIDTSRSDWTVRFEELRVCREFDDLSQHTRITGTSGLAAPLERFRKGLAHWARTGTCTEEFYLAQRELYTRTNGSLCDLVLEARRRVHAPRYGSGPSQGILGTVDAARRTELVVGLRRDGFLVFPGALPEATCAAWESFARETPSRPILGMGEFGEETLYGAHRAQVTRHILEDARVLAQPDMRRLAFDPTLLDLTRAYLGCEPTLTQSFMWWSTPVFDEPDTNAAQLYHFDLNHLNFVKVFVYLTDVGPENGPHCFVRGSHHRKPTALLRDGRFTDEEIATHYPEKDRLRFEAPRGTLILADTRGFHRGAMLTSGERLLFHMEYAASLAGKPVPEVVLARDEWSAAGARRSPRLWNRYRLADTK